METLILREDIELVYANLIGRKNYFIDESGTIGLFKRKRRTIVGQPGCSRFAMLGLLVVHNPDKVEQALGDLRAELLADPRFADPRFAKRNRDLECQFHAKNDTPEVRDKVFEVLLGQSIGFSAVVIDKAESLKIVKERLARDTDYQYSKHDEYDHMARVLLRDRLHKQESYHVRFSRRGKDRTQALTQALLAVRNDFITRNGIINKCTSVRVSCHHPHEFGCLQAVDYFLWALQRFYHTGEEEYIDLIWPRCVVINDRHVPGMGNRYFNKKERPDLAALKRARGT